MSKIYILVLFLVITILPSVMPLEKKKIVQRVLNPDLPVIKPSWQGNFMINKRFVNDTVSDEVTFVTILK